MSPIQGVSMSPAASYVPPKPAPVAKTEVKETAQDERKEASRGSQEVSEAKPTQVGPSGVGSRVNLMA
jgi:hypothetical protein